MVRTAGLTIKATIRRLVMTEGYYMTRAEIADALGVSEDVVKALLYRAISKIRRQHPELREWINEEAA